MKGSQRSLREREREKKKEREQSDNERTTVYSFYNVSDDSKCNHDLESAGKFKSAVVIIVDYFPLTEDPTSKVFFPLYSIRYT